VLRNIWQWLDGRKVKIGLFIIIVAGGAEQVGWMPQGSCAFITSILTGLGITAVGVGHKLYKAGEAAGEIKGYDAGVESCSQSPEKPCQNTEGPCK
jgi:hypothetical protein